MSNPSPFTGTGHDDSGQQSTRSPQDAPLAPADPHQNVSEGFRTADPGRTDTDSGQAGGYAPLAPAGQRPDDPAAPSRPAGGLTDEEIAEFRRLRQEDNDRTVAAREAAEKAEREKPPVSHYLHLANGDVVESAGTATHVNGMAVVNAVPVEFREEEK